MVRKQSKEVGPEEFKKRCREDIVKTLQPYKEMIDLSFVDFPSRSRREEKLFNEVFSELVEQGVITVSDDCVGLTKNLEKEVGQVQCTSKGFGFFIRPDKDDYYLPFEEVSKVLPGDVVVAVKAQPYDGREAAVILELKSRKLTKIVGRYQVKRGVGTVIPEDDRITQEVYVDPNGPLNAKNNEIVVVEIDNEGLITNGLRGRIVEVLGDIDQPGMEIEIAVRKFNVPHEFSAETEKEIQRFPTKVLKADLKKRVDLRDVPFVTIDGADARDFDDAVYCEQMPAKKSWRLLVAIADVSHYVKVGSAIDKDAQIRTTSVYFPRRVIPMLPEELSNGLCSLNPMVDRCTLVCDAIVNQKGEVTAYQFYPAVIRSAARLIYEDVWGALCDENGPQARLMADVLPEVQRLYELYKILQKSRHLRGAMDFETVETYIIADEQGKIEKILPRERNDAHRLIEEMMLVANTCAADFIKQNNATCLYRVHEPPSEERLEKARAVLSSLGLTLKGGAEPKPSDYAELLEKIADRPDKAMIQTVLLRSMSQAVYSPHNAGHFGLAYPEYTHFTSPIRRYPDLLVHRTIKAIIAGEKYIPKLLVEVDESEVTLTERKAAEDGQKQTDPNIKTWEQLGMICSSNERRADEASYDVMAWLKCYYMQQHIGSIYNGVITGVSKYALFITLEDLYVEGAVHVSTMADYFTYNEKTDKLVGTYSGVKFGIGDPVKVKVSNCDLDARRVEFVLAAAVRAPKPRSRAGRSNVKSSGNYSRQPSKGRRSRN